MKKFYIGLFLIASVCVINNVVFAQSAPTAAFTKSASSICSGSPVKFTNTTATVTPASTYLWSFGDGTTSSSTSDSLTHTFTSATTKRFKVSLTATNGYGNSIDTSSILVNANLTESVKITDNASANTLCAGSPVTFTATPTNGTGATYKWDTNGTAISGATGLTFSPSYLKNGDIVTCVMTATASCISGSPATSNSEKMIVNAVKTPSITIIDNATANTICKGTIVVFTATPVNGGTAPTYQWYDTTAKVGTSSTTYTTSLLKNANTVKCVMTSNYVCPTTGKKIDTSNVETMTVNPNLVPSVSIIDNATAYTICSGTSVTFTAAQVNGGTPTYQWYVGTKSAGTASTYVTDTLVNGNTVKCVMTSTETCKTTATATSNVESMIVNSHPVSVLITDNATANTICAGSSVKFTATPTNGGTSPTYQWYVGAKKSATSSTYTTDTLGNGDAITCVLKADPTETCTTYKVGTSATSNTETMVVNKDLPASVSIAASGTGVTGTTGTISFTYPTSVVFAATATNGGTTPAYQWKLNGSDISGAIYSTYTTSTLTNNSKIECVMISDATPCLTGSPATSNVITMAVSEGSIRGSIRTNDGGAEFQIFPNPAKGVLYVNANSKSLSDVVVTLTNTVGKTVLVKELNSTTNTTTFDISNLSEGIYFVKCQSKDIVNVQKVIITK